MLSGSSRAPGRLAHHLLLLSWRARHSQIYSVPFLSLPCYMKYSPSHPALILQSPFSSQNSLSFLTVTTAVSVQFNHSVQFSSGAQSCPTLCDPMNRSTPGLPVHHQLPEFTQTHVHQAGDAIQPSHALSSPSPPAPNPSQHQNLFQ